MNAFNLATDDWLPAHDLNGARRLLGLEALFQQAATLGDLDLRPHERVAVMRLLICITQAALGAPEDVSGWEEFVDGFEEKIAAYLQKWRAGFELFGDGPRFLQLKPDKTGEPVPVSKLIPHLATANNPTLFDHGGGTHRPLPPARLALALLTFQNFYPPYGAGHLGRGPCGGANMVHTFVKEDNLRATSLRNCLDADAIDKPQLGGMGRPIWEVPFDDQTALNNATRTYLGRLTPLHRAVWINDDGATFLLSKKGYKYPPFEQFREPTATVLTSLKKKTDYLLSENLERAVWRELDAITVLQKAESGNLRASGPLVLQTHRSDGYPEDIEIWTGTLVTDRQIVGKFLDLTESVFHVPSRMFDDTGRADYRRGVEYAQSRSYHLSDAVKAYGKAMKHESAPTDRASRHYWNDLDQQSTRLLELVREPSAVEVKFGGASSDPWTRAVRTALQSAYDAVCPRLTPRQYKAYNAGLAQLHPAPARKSVSKAKGSTKPLTAQR